MNKNFNPLNWTKKQQIIGGAVAIVLIGGVTTGIVANANHQAEVRKIEQLKKDKVEKAKVRAEKAKQLEKSNEADSKKLLDIAEKTPTDKNIKLAEDSILKVKNAEVKKAFDNQVVGIKNRVKLENEAKTAVSNYQKDAMNQDKYKTAQQSVNKLTSSYSKGLKDSLNKQLATSKKQADDATKAQQAKSASDSKAKATNTNKEQSDSTGSATNNNSNNANENTVSQGTANNNVASGSNSYGGGSQNNYSQGGSNTSQNNTNSGSSNQGQGNSGQNNSNTNTNTGGNGSNTNNNGSNGGNNNNNQPQTRYVGWVSVDGVRRYSQTFNTLGEAQSYADSVKNSQEVVNLLLDGHSIRYGVEPA
jgi:peptidoglycan DL-endopeptidase CwlO